MVLIHKVVLKPQNFHVTDDFTTVWEALNRFREGLPVYSEDYSLIDPHYLYSPGGTLLLSPLAFLPSFDLARIAYILVNGLAIVLALAVLTRLFNFTLRDPVWPLSIALLFSTESVKNTLLFSNINGVLFLAEVLFLTLVLKATSLRGQILSGIILGLCITIKPQFIPLIFLPLALRQITTIILAIVTPILTSLAAWPLMEQPGDYFNKLMPYLGQVRDYANSSIPGVGAYFGFPGWLTLFWQILAALFVLVTVLLLLRWRDREPLLWATTTTSILLIGVFLISSLGQMYYSMLLAPMFFTVLKHKSVMHNPIAWFGVYFCMSLDEWYSDRWHTLGRAFEYVRGTLGWSALLIAATATVIMWVWMEIKHGQPLLGDVKTGGIISRNHRQLPTTQTQEATL